MWEQAGTPDSTPRAAAPPPAWSATAASTSATSLSRFTMIALAVTLVATLFLPIAVARRANLTSDESLYLAEAHAIAGGRGLVYPSGEPITHRAPLYPALLAPSIELARVEGPYAVSKLIVAVNVFLVALIAWRIGGALAAIAGGIAAGASAFLNGFAATLYLDPLESSFVLLAIAALAEAVRRPRAWPFAAAGAAVGLSFLTKEAAVQYAPLGIAAWLALPALRTHTGARGAVAFTVAFAAVTIPWFGWVWVQTDAIFMLGDVSASSVALVALTTLGFGAFVAGVALWPSLPESRRAAARRLAAPAAVALVATWCALMLYMVESHDSWDYRVAYWSTIPRYLTTIAPAAQPYFLLVAAVVWMLYRALRGDDYARLLALFFVMFAPFAIVAANRSLQLRDALPMVYIAYIALGVGFASIARALAPRIETPAQELALGALAVVAAIVFVAQQTHAFVSSNTAAASVGVRADSWDSAFVDEIAASLERDVPTGANVLSSRLYFSSLDVDTDGRYHIRQMPTVGVDIDSTSEHLLVRNSNLFRWEDREVRPARAGDTWIWLKRFEGKDYWVGLGEEELLEYIRDHEIDYVLLTGEDAAFSSLHAAAYLSANPAFKLVEARRRSPSDQFYLYRVDRSALARIAHSTTLSPSDAASLVAESGLSMKQIEQELGTPVRISDEDAGLSPREEHAAVDGVDLGLQ